MGNIQPYSEVLLLEKLEMAHVLRITDIEKSILLTKEVINNTTTQTLKSINAKAKGRLAFYYMIINDFVSAIDLANEALVFFKKENYELDIADVTYTLASVYYKSGKLYLGLYNTINCMEIYTKYNDIANKAKCFKVMGTIYEFFNDIEKAIEAFESSIEEADKVGDLNMKTNAFNPLSGLYLNQGKFAKALSLIESSIAIKKQTGDTRGLAYAYYGRGKVFAKQKEYEKAETDYVGSLKMHKQVGEKLGTCMTLNKMGELYIDNNDLEKANNYLQEAIVLSEEIHLGVVKIKCYDLLFKLKKKENKFEEALYFLEKYQAGNETLMQNQSKEIVDSYSLIHQMQAEVLQSKMLIEKNEIIEAKNKAELVAKARQDFLSLMSHEIRTPLNAIISISNLLKNSKLPEEQLLIDSLRNASNSLLGLINDILDINKLESSVVSLDVLPVCTKEFFKKIESTYKSMALEKGLELELLYDNDLHLFYKFDAPKMSQIIGNLISNAIKFTEKGIIKLVVEKLASTMEIDTIKVSVIDTGEGIPEEFLKTIFDSFTQNKEAINKKYKGTGLGLAIVKNIAKLYQTKIQIETKIGVGSNFHFELKLEKDNSTIKSMQQKEVNSSNLEVLIVDDNPINLLVASKLLSNWKIKVDTVKSGKEAITQSELKKYDVILMDIHMPEMNGYETTIFIRNANSLNKLTNIFALTADITLDKKDGMTQQIFNGVLTKPIIYEELYNAFSML
jgi:signal transduction histidine kinase